ncbi:lysylphosphatidylglycerol synthase transmembrane domain-containing protein [Aquibacillus salsiterrae]|uniref:Phosphatidylglycerol lysyltransferase n=1 Tax=Aquibacillus salsiterrae TaxID=2950439 RepID=A0A9X3WEB9_9BACI|nr:lysylphosphatidylglycerol synthase transmembrane domain-containing protein [Aquibacillus salsiterrae]MDC3415859.1 flippase-like domain-containing protein [Aquibacillus salsiterrae]
MGKHKRFFFVTIRIAVACIFLFLVVQFFDFAEISESTGKLLDQPILLLMMVIGYWSSFYLKAKAWMVYVEDDGPVKNYLDAIFYSLVINHLLPVKGGELVRVGYIHHKNKLSLSLAAESTVAMRLLDLVILGVIAASGSFLFGISISFQLVAGLIIGCGLLLLGLVAYTRFRPFIISYLEKLSKIVLSKKGLKMVTLVFVSWLLEAIVIYLIVFASFKPIPILDAIWVNSFTIAGQVFQFTPGGIGTYESFMSIALKTVGYPLATGLTIAVVTHAVKFIFSFGCGLYVLLFAPIRLEQIVFWLKKKRGSQ